MKKLFIFLFQVESLKFTNFLTKFSYKLKYVSSFNFLFDIYKFNLFFHSLYISLDESFSFFDNVKVSNFFYSSDCFLKSAFDEFVLKYNFFRQRLLDFSYISFFYFRNFFVRHSNMYKLNIFFEKNIFSIPLLPLLDKIFKNKVSFKLSFPFNSLFQRMRILGFFHKLKFRPIALVRYIFSEDFLIIKFFSSILYSILVWYIKLNNFFTLNIFLDLIKTSCFLTLSRKHKKSLSWSYYLYTNKVLYFKSVSNTFFSFPSIFDFLNKNSFSFFYYVPFVLNESFFIFL